MSTQECPAGLGCSFLYPSAHYKLDSYPQAWVSGSWSRVHSQAEALEEPLGQGSSGGLQPWHRWKLEHRFTALQGAVLPPSAPPPGGEAHRRAGL